MQSGPWFAYRKTFLAGEYTACLYGRGLVITYGPPFELKQSTKMNLSAFAQTVIDQYPNIPTALTLSDSKPTHGGSVHPVQSWLAYISTYVTSA